MSVSHPDSLRYLLDGEEEVLGSSYDEQADIRYAAARLWVDAIVPPGRSREALLLALDVATRHDDGREFKTGVLQV